MSLTRVHCIQPTTVKCVVNCQSRNIPCAALLHQALFIYFFCTENDSIDVKIVNREELERRWKQLFPKCTKGTRTQL